MNSNSGGLPDASAPVETEIVFVGPKGDVVGREGVAVQTEIFYYVAHLAAGTNIRSISIALAGAERPQALAASPPQAFTLKLLSIRVRPAWSGFELLKGGIRISSGVSVYKKAGEERIRIEERPSLRTSFSSSLTPGVFLSYGPGGAGRSLGIEVDGAEALRIKLRPQGISTVLAPSVLGDKPRSLELVLPPGVLASAFYSALLDEKTAELADFGRILRSPPSDRDFDLYRWDLLPTTLIFDFKDYAIQDKYLKRLAFFVEKLGFKGRLASDEEIAGLHGWNAHDYRPLRSRGLLRGRAGEVLSAQFRRART